MSRWSRTGFMLVALAILGGGSIVVLEPERVTGTFSNAGSAQKGSVSFDHWLARSAARQQDFQEFRRYLELQGVSSVVPDWQLVRSDLTLDRRCAGEPFEIPPRNLWPNAVPVLRFIRAEVAPVVGPIEVVSAYRSERANRCAGGASESRHLTFSGFDLVTLRRLDNRTLFERLCGLHRKLGRAKNFGLGAYFDPGNPQRNGTGRFHIDLSGYRSWGYGYGGASSPCRQL